MKEPVSPSFPALCMVRVHIQIHYNHQLCTKTKDVLNELPFQRQREQ